MGIDLAPSRSSGAEGTAHPTSGVRRGEGRESCGPAPLGRGGRPALLMLSHAVPDPIGNADRARAWQWVRMAGGSHDIYLLAIADAPVHLRHWRAFAPYTRNSVITPRRWPHRAGRPITLHATGRAAVEQWMDHTSFDAVLCTHVAMADAASQIPARVHICDASDPPSVRRHQLARLSTAVGERRHRRMAQQFIRLEVAAGAQCDLLTVCDRRDTARSRAGGGRVTAMPRAIDLESLDALPAPTGVVGSTRGSTPGSASGWAPGWAPQLVVHVDWRLAAHRRMAQWFSHAIWPHVRQAVPHAGLALTEADQALDPLAAMRGDCVVVAPGAGHVLNHWPVLQAMALAAGVITWDTQVRSMQIGRADGALGVRSDTQWIAACVETLRNAKLRAALANAAFDCVRRRFALHQTAQPLPSRISPLPIPTPLAKAA